MIDDLAACPVCGKRPNLQTPAEEDGMCRRAYVLCFDCEVRCPDLPGWQVCHWTESGKAPFAPLRDHWNAWVAEMKQ